MKEYTFSRRSRDNLYRVHSDLVLVVSRGLLYSPVDFAISEGMRTSERQWKLRNAGDSKTLRSRHMQQKDGLAHAIDIVAVGDLDKDGDIDAQDKKHTWDPAIYLVIADAMKLSAKELGVAIKWGGDFANFFDGPHFQRESF